MKKIISLLCLMLSVWMVQAGSGKEYDLKKLQDRYKDDLAVYLDHSQFIDITSDPETAKPIILKTVKQRLLFLKDKAKFYSNQSIDLSEYFEEITGVEVTVIKPDGETFSLEPSDFFVVDSPSADWVFHDDAKSMVYDLKELGEGYEVNIQYTKRIKRVEFFDILYFISNYPILHSSIKIAWPKGVEMAFFEKNLDEYNVEKIQDSNENGKLIKAWIIKNIDAYEEKEETFDVRYYLPHLVFQLRSYTLKGERYPIVGNVSELHQLFQGFLKQKQVEGDLSGLHLLVDSMVVNKVSRLEKIDTIFNWVQENIKYIAFEDGINGYVPRSCATVMGNRFGDCKDMTSLLVEMLDHAGIHEAYVAWVGTREIPYLISEIPSPLSCNHVICVVEKDSGGYYYLDATSSESGITRPPKAIQTKELLIHKGQDEFKLFRVPVVEAEQNYVRTKIVYDLKIDDSTTVSGTDVYGGYERENISYSFENLDGEDLTNYVKNIALGGHNRFRLKDFKVKNLGKNDEDLILEYSFVAANSCIKDGEDIIVNPTLFKPRITKYDENKNRHTRYKGRKRKVMYEYEINLPGNYRIKHLPEDVKFEAKDLFFNGEFNLVDDKLFVRITYGYELLKLPPERFDEWNNFSSAVSRALIQNIILEKKTDD